MTSFKDAIEKKNVDYNSGYICECCNMTKYGKPWIIYDDKLSNDKNICSYLCCKKMSENDKNLWSKVTNKQDFIDLRPILPKKKEEFMILTKDELLNLDDKKLFEYYKDLNEYYYKNPERANMQIEIIEEYGTDDESEYSMSDSENEYWSDE
jgi:hypothetical protein